MRLMLKVNVDDNLLKGFKGTSDESYEIRDILNELIKTSDIVVTEAINNNYIVHRLTDEDIDVVLETMDDHVQEYFEDENNYEELVSLIHRKGEFGWAEDLGQLIDIFYDLMKSQE